MKSPRGPTRSSKIGRSLAFEITAALGFKAVALAIIYFAFFGPPHRIEVSAERAAQVILDAVPAQRGN